MFADDIVIYMRGTYIPHIQKVLQSTVSKVETWVGGLGLKFAPSKTKIINFTRKHAHQQLHILLAGEPIQQDTQVKFLGVTFDAVLWWNVHINNIQRITSQRLNMLKSLNGASWGADKRTSPKIYKSHIRSILDYGCIAYTSASRTSLSKLNTIQNQALRLASGAFKTSPVASIHAEINYIPLTHHRNALILKLLRQNVNEPTSLQCLTHDPYYT